MVEAGRAAVEASRARAWPSTRIRLARIRVTRTSSGPFTGDEEPRQRKPPGRPRVPPSGPAHVFIGPAMLPNPRLLPHFHLLWSTEEHHQTIWWCRMLMFHCS